MPLKRARFKPYIIIGIVSGILFYYKALRRINATCNILRDILFIVLAHSGKACVASDAVTFAKSSGLHLTQIMM